MVTIGLRKTGNVSGEVIYMLLGNCVQPGQFSYPVG